MNPLLFAVNLTPNSSGRVSLVSGVPGAAVLGQIVHGQLDVAAIVMLNVAWAVCAGLLESFT
jgi:hypothetical protein